ncbi:sensor histidine kinase [Pseudonocardia ailaonensis]|uniref:sensor histidine kinase n=1 Tax=Pseudonocardia ailaonensis TaxID=367279 RepID=UPI0031E0453D
MDGGDLRLPRAPGVIRRFWARHPRITDVVLVLLIGSTCFDGAAGPDGADWGDPRFLWGLPFVLVATAGVLFHRTRPFVTLGASWVGVVAWAWAPSAFVLAAAVFAVYIIPVRRPGPAVWWATGVTVALACAAALLSDRHTPLVTQYPGLLLEVVPITLALLVATLVGTNVGNRRRYLSALVDRAHQLARERDQQALLAAAGERARIAREMHDVVSHSLTVMVALAEGAAVAAATSPERATMAMGQVADTGRTALTDMRRMLGVLGGDERASLAPQPSLAELPALVRQFADLGLPVTAQVRGTAPGDPALQLTIYRVVQEALTNSMRYARTPTAVTVTVDAEADPIVVTVEDDGRGPADAPSVGAGRGLLGLTERVAALGGEFRSGPRARGWRVSASLPAGSDR